MNGRLNKFALFALCVVAWTGMAHGVTHLKRQMDAPRIALKDLGGADVGTEKLRGQVVVLIFGELYHEKTRQACTQICDVLEDNRLAGESIVAVLITAQEPKPDELKPRAAEKLPATIARDPNRQAFGAYQVVVMPSVVVLDQKWRVVHAVAGLIPRFDDLLTDSLLYATGKLSAEGLERSLNPQPTTAVGEHDNRAERIAQLARQLTRRGLDDMAAEKYREAIELNPRQTMAHLDLGMLLLKHQRLAEAEAQFRSVLSDKPKSIQASLGLAFVQTLRGGAELDEAEKTVRDVLAQSPSQPRAHYLLGLIAEQRSKSEDASASFKKAAQLLLERAEQE